jgi:hypothetical protein
MTNAWIAFKFQTFSINLWRAIKQGKYWPSHILPLSQIIGRFGILWFHDFTMHLDVVYI